ncbi:MAG TPA: 2-amino-4-hydroxy-6-hydroxymethyldihydropteridine diphosphokinase [Mycobacteriales bacterium]|nr:2-amino-4-hydroxy-6-hydroxymethyldihydropteridine diphosphokinase [Mycobacteriales bacterium]
MSRAVLAIGSNLGDRLAHLRSTVDGLKDVLVAASPVFETAPWGGIDQDDFLNGILIVQDAAAGPFDWLERCHELERAAERVREVRWGPRTLDVDVITVHEETTGDVRSADPRLILPHPRAHERAFVLVPWLAADPHAYLPGHGRVAELVARLDTSVVIRRDELELT